MIQSLFAALTVSLISLIGIFFVDIKKVSRVTKYFVSIAAGALISDVFLHILPEVAKQGFSRGYGLIMIFAILFYIILEGVVRWHHSHSGDDLELHSHGHSHIGWLSLVGGLVHNMVDGIAIAASFAVSNEVGIITTFAIIMHEIPHEIANFGVLIHSGFSKTKAIIANFVTALTSLLGVVLFYSFPSAREISTGLSVFAAGALLYIALADMIPEVHENNHKKIDYMSLVFIILGMVLIGLLVFIEPSS